MFNTNMYVDSNDLHVFTTDEKALENIGLASYTYDSLNNNLSSTDPDMIEYFNNNIVNVKNQLLCVNPPSKQDIAIFKFNKIAKEYEYEVGNTIFKNSQGIIAATSLQDFIIKYAKAHQGYSVLNRDAILEIGEKIQTSKSGCITFVPSFTVLDCEVTPLIKVHFRDPSYCETGRTLAQRGAPLIVDVPRRPSGPRYSWRATDLSEVGVYSNPADGGIDNPANTVAGPLSMHYNPAIGSWESGTRQILARLASDIDPAPLNNVNMTSLNEAAAQTAYNSSSDIYMGQFTKGKAVPLSVENGNPHKFGPNIIGCPNSDTGKVEHILVINRSTRSFKSGEIVLCSFIDGEWIIQAFDSGVKGNQKINVKNWQFQKYMIHSAAFFKYNPNKRKGKMFDDPGVLPNFTPSMYESEARRSHYQNSLYHMKHVQNIIGDLGYLDIKNANLFIDVTNILNGKVWEPGMVADMVKNLNSTDTVNLYYNANDEFVRSYMVQSTIFDQLGANMGGLQVNTKIGRTNILYQPNINLDNEIGRGTTGYQFMPFWGPLFPDGYSANDVLRLKKNTNRADYRFSSKQYYTGPNDGRLLTAFAVPISDISKIVAKDRSDIPSYEFGSDNMFQDSNDPNLKQLPAEAALHGPNFPFFDVKNNVEFVDKPETKTRLIKYHTYLADSDNVPAYGLTPVNSNKIQFSPLSLELALSNVNFIYSSSIDPDQLNTLRTTIQNSFSQIYGFGNESRGKYLLGPMFKRQDPTDKDRYSYGAVRTSYPDFLLISRFPFGSYGLKSDNQKAPLPVGSPDPFIPYRNTRPSSEVVGVIASQMNFVGPSNGSVRFTTTSYFGLPPKKTFNTGSLNVYTTYMGGGQAFISANGTDSANTFPQWGDGTRSDDYNSFGTTALHVRIFDGWPDNQTFYDGRYFAVLHSNPSVLMDNYNPEGIKPNVCERHDYLIATNSDVALGDFTFDNVTFDIAIKTLNSKTDNSTFKYIKDGKSVPWDTSQPLPAGYRRTVDIAETSVDFREPTQILSIINPSRVSIPINTKIDSSGNVEGGGKLLPSNEWSLNIIRRGRLLTNGGFLYVQKVIGIKKADIEFAKDELDPAKPLLKGKDYIKDQIISLNHGAFLKVVSVGVGGSLESFDLVDKDGNSVTYGGEGFIPSDFNQPIAIPSTTGSRAKIIIKCGRVYGIWKKDECPKERVSSTRLTPPSNGGSKVVDETLQTVLTLQKDSTLNPTNNYSAFFFFHNDIGHTVASEMTYAPSHPQYVTLEVAGG
ncbi:hypothetical protein EB001_09890 [bacterium]|nr:hypothetical protein [bacterium]